MSFNHAYSTYGAYEMKASYQRNMLYGNLAVLGLVTMLLSIAWLYSLGVEPPIEIIPTIGVEWAPSPPTPFDPNKIRIKRQASKMTIKKGTIPTMISDSLFFEEDPNELIMVDEKVAVGGEGDGPIDSGEPTGNLGGINGRGINDVYPDETQFVPHEKEPEMYHQVKPTYPRLCRKAGIEGKVIIKVLLDKEGNVVKAKIAKSSGIESLDRAALEVAPKNKFSPALQNSIPIPLWVSYTVQFRLY